MHCIAQSGGSSESATPGQEEGRVGCFARPFSLPPPSSPSPPFFLFREGIQYPAPPLRPMTSPAPPKSLSQHAALAGPGDSGFVDGSLPVETQRRRRLEGDGGGGGSWQVSAQPGLQSKIGGGAGAPLLPPASIARGRGTRRAPLFLHAPLQDSPPTPPGQASSPPPPNLFLPLSLQASAFSPVTFSPPAPFLPAGFARIPAGSSMALLQSKWPSAAASAPPPSPPPPVLQGGGCACGGRDLLWPPLV